jgi:hypothetical protein
MATFDSNFSAILALMAGGSGALVAVLTAGNTTGDNAIIVSNQPNARIQGEDSNVANAGDLNLRGGNTTAGDGGDVVISVGLGSVNDGQVIINGEVQINGDLTSDYLRYGTGTPEGVVTADVGTLYRRLDGTVGTSLYTKVSGVGNTGWIPVGPRVCQDFIGDGVTSGFVTTRPYIIRALDNLKPTVYWNGQKLRDGLLNDFVFTPPNTINMTITPLIGDIISIEFLPAD